MTIQEMHTTFRTLGQQMGIQLIRGILPESIDVYLNQSINDKVRDIVVKNSTTPFHDRIAIQDNSISPINSLRTISKKKSLDITGGTGSVDFYTIIMDIENVMFYTSFGIRYPNINKRVGTRFIESDKLDDTRKDYCNRETWDEPIITMFTNDEPNEYVELYTDNTTKIPNKIEVSYIANPDKVKWDSVVDNRVDCNLPLYLHPEIVELAVDRFFRSVGATTKPVTR